MKLSHYTQLFPVHDGEPGYPTIDDATIDLLSKKLRAADPGSESGIPSGYTYFGQFVNHDLSFMQQTDKAPGRLPLPLDCLRNRRRPNLDLDSMYGSGLYDSAVPYDHETGAFVMGRVARWDATGTAYTLCDESRDFPRGKEFRAMIADPRNDENLLVARIQVLFMELHNKLIAMIRAQSPKISAFAAFKKARKEVVQLYRYVVLHDFARILLNTRVYEEVIVKKRRLKRSSDQKRALPIEFTVAAFRLHGMVRSTYRLQAGTPLLSVLQLLTYHLDARHQQEYLLDESFVVDWAHFFGREAQLARAISPRIDFDIPNVVNACAVAQAQGSPAIAKALHTQMNAGAAAASTAATTAAMKVAVHQHLGSHQHGTLETQGLTRASTFNLIARSIRRGGELRLASADYIIARIRKNHPGLAKDLMLENVTSVFLNTHWPNPEPWMQKLPLWLYCMLEGWEHYNGTRPGILGSLIVADTLRTAYEVSKQYRTILWTPAKSRVHQTLAQHNPGQYTRDEITLRDLVQFVYHTPV